MLLSPEATEEETNSLVERVSGFITSRGGTITGQDSKGVHRLGYPVRGFLEANEILTRFTMGTAEVGDLRRAIKATEAILRFLLTER